MAKIYGFENDMFILKGYIYEKEGRYLSLFSMVPTVNLDCEVKTFTDKEGHTRPLTSGVYVRVIGSMTGIIPTDRQVSLKFYQDMITNQGWKFKTTVPGIRGTEWVTAQKLAWAEIQRVKRFAKLPTVDQDTKDSMLELIDDIEELTDKGVDITSQLTRLTTIINNL